MLSVLTTLAGFATTWFEGQRQKAEAKASAEVIMEQAKATVYQKKAAAEEDWDLLNVENAQNSWKDEYLLLLFSIPFVMAFIPQLQEYVKVGFEVLENTPEWYRYSLGVMVAASFGMKSYLRFFKK